MKKKIFITGTDTNIGKTIISRIMLIKASKKGFLTAGYKPVATGCIKTKNGLRNEDALFLIKDSIIKFPYKNINPFPFYYSQPPNILSKQQKINIDLNKLSYYLKIIEEQSNWIIIEGVGGWYTPISNTITFSDWVKKENLPVILVVGLKLGCINHAILTSQAILKSNVQLIGWIANSISLEKKYFLDYIDTIKKYINAPFLGRVPYMKNIKNIYKYYINIKLP